MMPEPSTEEGLKEIAKRIEKAKKSASNARKNAFEDINDEPCGKLTAPSEIDLHRDRKHED